MARRYKVTLRKNGAVCGEAVYATRGEALSAAAKMQGAASGIEAVLAQMDAPSTNPRRPRRNGADPFAAVRRSIRKEVARYVEDGPAASGASPWGRIIDAAYRVAEKHRTLHGMNLPVEQIVAEVNAARDEAEAQRRVFLSSELTAAKKALREQQSGTRRNPSIGRGTAHRDMVAEAIEEKLRAEGVAPKQARSRAFAIATAAEQRRQGLRANPTPIDIASLDFPHFKKTVKIAGYYNVRTGRRFARVVSKDGTFVTDVPVADGGKAGSRAKGADAIKRRAYEQLRIHIEPSKWKPSVRVNPAGVGRVPYKGAAIKVEAGTYTVEPHGATFSGPGGFVAAKKWIEQNI